MTKMEAEMIWYNVLINALFPNYKQIVEQVNELLKVAKDRINNDSDDWELPEYFEFQKQDVEALVSKLRYELTSQIRMFWINYCSFLDLEGQNQAALLTNILPIIHLLRLFYGFDYEEILYARV